MQTHLFLPRLSADEALAHPWLTNAPGYAASLQRSLGGSVSATVSSAAAATSTVFTTAGKTLGRVADVANMVRGYQGIGWCTAMPLACVYVWRMWPRGGYDEHACWVAGFHPWAHSRQGCACVPRVCACSRVRRTAPGGTYAATPISP